MSIGTRKRGIECTHSFLVHYVCMFIDNERLVSLKKGGPFYAEQPPNNSFKMNDLLYSNASIFWIRALF
jgi:hypothetical protein